MGGRGRSGPFRPPPHRPLCIGVRSHLLICEGNWVGSRGPVRAWVESHVANARRFLPGATYHVYCPFARGEPVFDDDFEVIEFVKVLRTFRDPRGSRISSHEYKPSREACWEPV